MSFNRDEENAVSVHHVSHQDHLATGAHGQLIHSKSISSEVKPRAVRKPFSNVNQQHVSEQSDKNKDKSTLKSSKPFQSLGSNVLSGGAKPKPLSLKSTNVPETKPAAKGNKVVKEASKDSVKENTSNGNPSVTQCTAAISSSENESYPDIEQPAFRYLEDDDSDLWSMADRPESYLKALLNWRPSMFSASHTHTTPYMPDPPSLSSSPLTNDWTMERNSWTMREETLDSPLKLSEVILPELPDLSLTDDSGTKRDCNRSIDEDLLFFSALN